MSKRQRIEFVGDEEADQRRAEGSCGVRKQPKRPMDGLVPCSSSKSTQRQRHLVLDDYSVYRVGDDDELGGLESPVVRFEAPHLFCPSFAAHGTKIFAMRPSAASSPAGIPVFDTETLGVTTCPFPRSRAALGALNLVHASEKLGALNIQ